jgi:hypothetical protein
LGGAVRLLVAAVDRLVSAEDSRPSGSPRSRPCVADVPARGRTAHPFRIKSSFFLYKVEIVIISMST